jgi:hypothetical protein
MIIKAFLGVLFFSVTTVPLASAYGGGGGGLLRPSCTPPSFSEQSPPKDAVIPSFSEVSFVTSPNTNKSTVVVKINGQPAEVTMTEKGPGGLRVTGKPPQAITEAGFATISLSAASAPGCTKNYAYRVKVGG